MHYKLVERCNEKYPNEAHVKALISSYWLEAREVNSNLKESFDIDFTQLFICINLFNTILVCFIVIILPHFNKVYEKIRKDAAIICNREPKVTRCCTCLRCSHQFFLNCKLPKDCTRRPGILLFHLSRFSNQQSNAAKRCHDGSRLGEHILFHRSVGLSIHNSWVLWRLWQNYIFSSETAWRPLNKCEISVKKSHCKPFNQPQSGRN